MFVTIITDCYDPNTTGRQLTRANALFGCPANLVSVDFKGDNQAAGNLVDMLDSCEGREGVVLVNVAPRDGKAKKWENGTPFGFFQYYQTLIVSSIDGKALSLIKKLDIASKVRVFDIPTVLSEVPNMLSFYEGQTEYIKNTQFRSFEFLPRVAKWIKDGIKLPVDEMPLEEVPDIEGQIWWTDNFGNCKTTILPEEIKFEHGKEITLEKVGKITCYSRLKDVPNGEKALIIGSSGIKDKRFLEIVLQGKSASKELGLSVGDILLK